MPDFATEIKQGDSMTTLYITKYALTSGPIELEGEITKAGTLAVYHYPSGYQNYAHRGDFFLTKEEALNDCEMRRQKKLASIEKQRRHGL